MSAQTIRRRLGRRALIPTFALITVTPLLSCSTDGDPISDVEEFARFDALVEIHNLRTVYSNGTAFVRGGSAHITIPAAGENPPCCLVLEGGYRLTEVRVLPGETLFIRAYAVTPGVAADFTRWEQDRCRVTGTQPDLTVTYDNGALNHLVCSKGWENL